MYIFICAYTVRTGISTKCWRSMKGIAFKFDRFKESTTSGPFSQWFVFFIKTLRTLQEVRQAVCSCTHYSSCVNLWEKAPSGTRCFREWPDRTPLQHDLVASLRHFSSPLFFSFCIAPSAARILLPKICACLFALHHDIEGRIMLYMANCSVKGMHSVTW